MAYRGDFFISAFIMLLFEFIAPFVTLLIYQTGSAFPGWNLYEALLIQGIFLLSKGIALPFFGGIIWNIMNRVREGTFDLLLIKPRSILHLSIVTMPFISIKQYIQSLIRILKNLSMIW